MGMVCARKMRRHSQQHAPTQIRVPGHTSEDGGVNVLLYLKIKQRLNINKEINATWLASGRISQDCFLERTSRPILLFY